MMRLGITTLLLSAVCCMLSAEAAPAEHPKPTKSVGAQLLSLTNEMWFLLSGVVDTETADAAAARFSRLAEQSSAMSDKLFDADAQALDVEALDQDTYRIAEAYEDLSYEFESLCRSRCYGSSALINAFLSAMKLGVFSDDSAEHLMTTSTVLSEEEAKAEIARLQRLHDPDAELLAILTKVQDSRSATAATTQLGGLSTRLQSLQPVHRFHIRNFSEQQHGRLRAACEPLEALLWKIRCEIVRIVSLPGYDHEQFDDFSDALDVVFDYLGSTHAECFDDVFDASFRSDLDDALHESVTSSQR